MSATKEKTYQRFDTFNCTTIPPELKQLPQWVLWKLEVRQGESKQTKVPYNAATGGRAATSKRDTWNSFNAALDAFEKGSISKAGYMGIGIVLAHDDPYCGVDLDDCFDAEGQLYSWAQEIVNRFDSYTEYSPSGQGLRIFIRAKINGGRRTTKKEIYDRGRYLTVTGRIFKPGLDEIKDRQMQAEQLLREMRPSNSSEGKQDISSQAKGFESIDITLDANGNVSPAVFGVLEELLENSKFKKTWNRARGTDLNDHSASGYCQSIASFAAALNIPDQTIAELMLLWRTRHNEDIELHRIDKYQRTIFKAKQSSSIGSADALMDLEAAIESIDLEEDNAEARNREDAEQSSKNDANASHRQDALSAISDLLKVPIVAVYRMSETNTVWEVVFGQTGRKKEDRLVSMGGTDAFRSQQVWQKTIYELYEIEPPGYKAPQWKAITESLAKVSIIIEGDNSLASWIRRYINENIIGEHLPSQDGNRNADNEDEATAVDTAFISGYPFILNGDLYISANTLYLTIKQHGYSGGVKASDPTIVRIMLRHNGWEAVKMTRACKVKKGSKSFTTRKHRSLMKIEYSKINPDEPE